MRAAPRPFLTARWSNLILATYRVDPDLLVPLLPPDCRLDLVDGRGLISLVAFNFLETRVLGVRWPGFVNFPEVNLRFYVRHGCDEDKRCTERRGVVFIREFVPQKAVAAIARLAYNEPYRSTRMRSRVAEGDQTLQVEHRLRIRGRERTIRVTADAAHHRPAADSTEAFLIEHQWGFGTSRRGRLIRYEVLHEPWDVHPVHRFDLDWDWTAAYGPRFGPLQRAEPASVVLAVGSAVAVYPHGRIDRVAPARLAAVPPTVGAPEEKAP